MDTSQEDEDNWEEMKDAATPMTLLWARLPGGGQAFGWLSWVVWVLTFVALGASTTEISSVATIEAVRLGGVVLGTMSVATIGALIVSRGDAAFAGWLLLAVSFLWSVGPVRLSHHWPHQPIPR